MSPPHPAPPTTFAELLTRHQSHLYALVCAMVGSRLAGDVLQDTNRVLWEQADAFDPGRPFLPWASAVARNQARAARKKAGRDRLTFGDQLAERLADRIEARHQGHDSRRAALAECLERVPDHQRELLLRRYRDSEAVQDIAASFGRTANAVAVALHRVRAALADCITGRTGEVGA